MSIESVFTDLAAAIRELAQSNIKAAQINADSTVALASAYQGSMAAYATGGNPLLIEQAPGNLTPGLDVAATPPDEEIEKAVQQVESEATMTRAIPKAELQAALDAAKAEAKKNAGAAGTQTSTGADTAGYATAPAALDYEKDVKPVLVQLASAKGKPELTKLVKSFGVDKANEIKPELLADVVAQAQALMAA